MRAGRTRASGGTTRPAGQVHGDGIEMYMPNDPMDVIDRVLAEHADALADELSARVGMTPEEAKRLVGEAGPDLIESCRWQEAELSLRELTSPRVVRDLLEGMSGSAVAARVGLPPRRAWAALRVLVPAVVRAAAGSVESDLPRPESPVRGSDSSGNVRFEIGFGLSFETGNGAPHRRGGAAGEPRAHAFRHPVFGALFPLPGR